MGFQKRRHSDPDFIPTAHFSRVLKKARVEAPEPDKSADEEDVFQLTSSAPNSPNATGDLDSEEEGNLPDILLSLPSTLPASPSQQASSSSIPYTPIQPSLSSVHQPRTPSSHTHTPAFQDDDPGIHETPVHLWPKWISQKVRKGLGPSSAYAQARNKTLVSRMEAESAAKLAAVKAEKEMKIFQKKQIAEEGRLQIQRNKRDQAFLLLADITKPADEGGYGFSNLSEWVDSLRIPGEHRHMRASDNTLLKCIILKDKFVKSVTQCHFGSNKANTIFATTESL